MRTERRPAWADGWKHPMERPPAVYEDEDDEEVEDERDGSDDQGGAEPGAGR